MRGRSITENGSDGSEEEIVRYLKCFVPFAEVNFKIVPLWNYFEIGVNFFRSTTAIKKMPLPRIKSMAVCRTKP